MHNKLLLQNVLDHIEEHITEKVTIESLAGRFDVSEIYLRKLFKSAFHMPISAYIKKRKLSGSAALLLGSDLRIADVAAEYGYEFPQTYINAFKKEYGITPFQWKKSGSSLKITERLCTSQIMEVGEQGMILPDLVILPAFLLCGTKHTLGFEESHHLAPAKALEFWENTYPLIEKVEEKGVYYGVTKNYDKDKKCSDYYCMARVCVRNDGHHHLLIDSLRYARFTYVGNHSYRELSIETAREMYQAIEAYFSRQTDFSKVFSQEMYFERVDTRICTENFCTMEWYIPYE